MVDMARSSENDLLHFAFLSIKSIKTNKKGTAVQELAGEEFPEFWDLLSLRDICGSGGDPIQGEAQSETNHSSEDVLEVIFRSK